MPRIRQLSSQVVSRIAAGEVIERPSSVVKELLENSVDAGATRIDIELELGGTELIRVVDDGCGIDPDDLALAFSSHATSKLETADDLFRIGTMGFRGEALASIGGVAQVSLQSRTPESERGAELRCDGGDLSDVRPWNGSPGTRIEVRHLFYTVPVRKKFLKSPATEFAQVCETVTRLSLAHPKLHLTLRNNGKLAYDLPATDDLLQRIGLFFGAEVRDCLFYLDTGPGPVRMSGFVANPAHDRGNAKLQYFFVNGRWFRDRSLAHAFQEAYRGLLMTGRYPIGFLFLEVPPDQVDVNVHPTKAEVRFRENSILYSLVRSGVKARLLKENLVPQLEAPQPVIPPAWEMTSRDTTTTGRLFSPRQESAEQSIAPWERPPLPTNPIVIAPPEIAPQVGSPTPVLPMPEVGFSFPSLPPGAVLQVHDTYLVVDTPEGMLVIDQHALHERILYEQLRQRVREGRLEVQRLLIPEPIELPPAQAAAVLDAAPQLAELGLEVTEFGGNTILLSSYPTLLSRRPPHEILKGVVDYLVSKDRPPAKEVLLDHLLATMACKAAVKAGDRLTQDEIAHLLELREFAEDSHHCPHGRPTSLIFSRQELDRQFRRI